MILFENQLKTPGKKYKLNVDCFSTRRLSAIEWLVLTCINEFHESARSSGITLKYVFEDVFKIQDSDLLINPCISELMKMGVIEIDSPNNYSIGKTILEDISLTPLGITMLADGMLPGEPRSLPVTVFYNPLTGLVHSSDSTVSKSNRAIELGDKHDYDDDYPEQLIIDELQSGRVGSGRFIASKNLVKGTSIIEETIQDCYTPLQVEVDAEGIMTTNPRIVNPTAKDILTKLCYGSLFNRDTTDSLTNANDVNAAQTIGSGDRIYESLKSIIQNGRFIFMDYNIYNLLRDKNEKVEGKIIILFNSPTSGVETQKREDDSLVIYLPDSFSVQGCSAINDSNDSVSICKGCYLYEGREIVIPLAFKDNRLRRKNTIVIKWFDGIIDKYSEKDISTAGLAALPFLASSADKRLKTILKRWDKTSLPDSLSELGKIIEVTKTIGYDLFDEETVADSFIQKILAADGSEMLEGVSTLINLGCLKVGSEKYNQLIKYSLQNYSEIKDYDEIAKLKEAFHIEDRETAMHYDDLVEPLYNTQVLTDLINRIVFGAYEAIKELFAYDSFFNDYSNSIKQIELLVAGLRMFERMDAAELKDSIIHCPDIAKLQYNIAQISEKNSELIAAGINIFDVMKRCDASRANAFYANVNDMLSLSKGIINGIVESASIETENNKPQIGEADDSTVTELVKEEVVRSVYIVDTCAMMHRPDLFLYFSPNEYIRIPTRVIAELGSIKDRHYGEEKRLTTFREEAFSTTARSLSKKIEGIYNEKMNKYNRALLIVENGDTSLLPEDLDRHTPDHIILSVALKYKNWDAHLITDDNQFRILGRSQGIDSITVDEFIKNHNQYYSDESSLEVKYKGAARRQEKENKVKETVENAAKSAGNASIETILATMKITTLKQFLPGLNDKMISYLMKNKIKNVADFSMLNQEKISMFNADAKETVLKNGLNAVLLNKDDAIEKIRKKYGIED